MKLIIKGTENEMMTYLKAKGMASALFEITANLKKMAYWHEEQNGDDDMIQWIFEQINRILDDNNVMDGDIL